MTAFTDLPPPWQAALEEAWAAYRQHSLPIGAVIVNDQGEVVARGRNRLGEERFVHTVVSGGDLAHAEINALLALPHAERPAVYGYTLYTTVEPCPQCLGALVMSGVRGLNYAARDPWAGCADLLDTHPYMRGKKLRVSRPPGELQDVCGAFVLASPRMSLNGAQNLFLDAHEREVPRVLRAARHLHETRALALAESSGATASEVYDVIRTALRAVPSPGMLADA